MVLILDKELLEGVKRSMKEAKAGKGRILKSNEEMNEYFKNL